MTVFLMILGLVLVLFLVYLALLIPRRNYPGWEKLDGVRYAHRGLHDKDQGRPENSLAAFRLAAEKGFGAELDVHLMADGKLAVVHDSSLKRVCGREAVIEDLRAEDLAGYPLYDTQEHIPLLRDVLEVFEGGTPLVIELKSVKGNAAALTDAVMAELKGWNGTYCIESFQPGVIRHLRAHYPEVVRGQLSANFMNEESLGWFQRVAMTYLLTTSFTRPDFIAYDYHDRSCPSLRLMRGLFRVHEVGWTIRDRGAMERLEADGVTVIFEKFVP